MITLAIYDKDRQIKVGKEDSREIFYPLQVMHDTTCQLATQNVTFAEGDYVQVSVSEDAQYVLVKVDETMPESLIYLPKAKVAWRYQVTFEKKACEARPEQRFLGKRHYLTARLATKAEIDRYQNLALNAHDQNQTSGAYPHAVANVETRNDATFFAQNAIDGCKANLMHGSYPFQSWGINQQKDAQLTVEFGRAVKLDKLVLTLRADFPHDSFWTSVTVIFSDGSEETFATEKTAEAQVFHFAPRTVKAATLCKLCKAVDESPFPALTQLEFWGKNK
jgi:hypothetical protein